MPEKVTPYKDREAPKKQQVEAMFDNISRRYDFLNHFLSAGTDIRWRNKVVRRVVPLHPEFILDVATGTADLALAMKVTSARKITGIDISEGMLERGREKVKGAGLEGRIELSREDSEALSFENEHFDVVTAAFGVRNFENLEKGLKEMQRVLKKGGGIFILEFSQPVTFPLKQLYQLYFRHILPLVGKFFSKDNSAYRYLPESVNAFPHGTEFLRVMEECGFRNCRQKKLTGGIASIYSGTK